ncbi:hypothetical protein SAMN04488519_1035 [Algoriphagus ornithinivorans]|uniref:Outer membrane protein beta-barrel domain-containing protein n=1 Tax=Algoriphagus ornithinivorans TaxID=226506 RepID=A0A1I5DFI1_9BACT|nr:DUF3575 domain-containing protein [Algoriphagus ornithinivorans]SFN98005.1 hypothetical protein SAMN04488519_1035 [Algoriphagus ornithinivorans]
MKLQIISALFILTFGIATTSTAQQDLGLERQLLVKASPLAFLEPETIVLQGGIEYFFSNKISIQSEIGVNGGIFGIKADRGKNEDYKLWRTKNELKFYTKKNYWAIEFFLMEKDFIRLDDYYVPFRQEILYDRAQIDFRVVGGGLKFGRQVFTSRNILVDSFVGLGIRGRYRDVEVLELSEVQSRAFFEKANPFAERYRFEGWDSVPHLTIGVKVGILTENSR